MHLEDKSENCNFAGPQKNRNIFFLHHSFSSLSKNFHLFLNFREREREGDVIS